MLIIQHDRIQITLNQQDFSFERKNLPEDFLTWQSQARIAAFEIMRKAASKAVVNMPAHLPVMVTYGEGCFPANMTSKGMGLLPLEEHLEFYCEKFEQVAQANRQELWEKSLEKRLEAVQSFYSHPQHFDSRVLGGLEIFEGSTYKNLTTNPRASLLYSGQAPLFPSYQMDGFVEIIQPGNLRYRYLLAARELFARDAFHIQQIHYPFGYIFYPVDIRDKTPFPRR